MITNVHVAMIIAVCALVTFALRWAPFVIWGGKRKAPEYIIWLGNILPYALIAMLVVYCVKDMHVTELGSLIPTVISVIFVGIVQVWKRNSIISIIAGTVCYMALLSIMG